MASSKWNDVNITDLRYYSTLESHRTADIVEIKRAYRRLSLFHHPDKNLRLRARATENFQRDAYDVLSDPDDRSPYNNRIFQAYIQDLESRKDYVASCLIAKQELDTAEEVRLSALGDFQQHLQAELNSAGQLAAISDGLSSSRSASDAGAYTDRELDQAKARFQNADAKLREAQARMDVADRSLDENTARYQTLRYEYTGNAEFWDIRSNHDDNWNTAEGWVKSLNMELEQTKAEIGMITLEKKGKDLENGLAELSSFREKLQHFQAANAAYAAKETAAKKTANELKNTKAKLGTANADLSAARAQLLAKDEINEILKAENQKLKQAMTDYVDNMSKIEDSVKKAKHVTTLLRTEDEEAINADTWTGLQTTWDADDCVQS